MGSDCTVPIDDGLLNIRVGAIILKDGKFLMVGNEKDDFLYSVGGRIKFGETAEEAVVREVFEETGVKMEIDRLGFIHENYFTADYKEKDLLVYEISFFFYMKYPKGTEFVSGSATADGSKERLVWVDENTPTTYYPDFFRTELKHPEYTVKHLVTDNRI